MHPESVHQAPALRTEAEPACEDRAQAPKERPILFSGAMVRALLAGTKTQTRRVLPTMVTLGRTEYPGKRAKDGYSRVNWLDTPEGIEAAVRECKYGQPGDRLWVRESWAPGDLMVFNAEKDDPETILYRADRAALHWDGKAMRTPMDTYAFNWDSVRWKPSIHMPRWASRITLEVTDVRVERLNDCSRGDAMAEGCPFPNMADGPDPRQWYAELWEQINGPGSWQANPWVWVLSFRQAASVN